ncbi:MAG TPA: ATP-grasp domain-containing protein [Desulfobacteraceae bacterium]|nr:ATP-grasp domain-containing protein [Desulfobacteraceae bacterium]HPJ68111.1 ATP-grasp domain-containing protein [Desulfobacteraceae bacterium]HPQ29152.1 ATP-grasp domain-containing protein [Desulfobacteraceae bacterium]
MNLFLKRVLPVCNNTRVLVVGTTTDYIDWIRKGNPKRAIFLTDRLIRQKGAEPCPSPEEEILCDLSDYNQSIQAVKKHIARNGFSINGIACFDCESMELSSFLAQYLELSYPDIETIRNCRDKYVSKVRWTENGLKSPAARLIKSREEASAFFRDIKGPCVLKPLSGSGSELVFCCTDEKSCEKVFNIIDSGIRERQANRMYHLPDPEQAKVIAEELIEGIEFSCDFMIEDNSLEVIRLTRKIHSPAGPLGTIRGYVLTDSLPDGIEEDHFLHILHKAASSLGVCRAICMLDFVARGHEIILLELTPRPGGDCLPFLLRRAWDFDILTSALDFAQKRRLRFSKPKNVESYIGLRLHAYHGGILERIDTERLRQDARVCEIFLTRGPGHLIRMPPEDYDSWLLGHVIFKPYYEPDFETQCNQLSDSLRVEIN